MLGTVEYSNSYVWSLVDSLCEEKGPSFCSPIRMHFVQFGAYCCNNDRGRNGVGGLFCDKEQGQRWMVVLLSSVKGWWAIEGVELVVAQSNRRI